MKDEDRAQGEAEASADRDPVPFEDLWRRHGALFAGAVVAVLVLGGYALLKLGPQKAPDLRTPEATIRSLVDSLRASDTDTRTYEPFFQDKAVAAAIAQSVREGGFPKTLGIGDISAETGSNAATVTVRWSIKRPNIAENGSQFFLKRSDGAWRIVDARSTQVGSGAAGSKTPRGKEATAAP